MKNKKQKNKKMTMDGLAGLMKQGFKKNQEEMAVMVKNAFQGNQEYMDKRFDNLTGEMRGGFRQVTEKINNISKNIIDVIHQEDFDKLESRVVDVEEIVKLQLKKS